MEQVEADLVVKWFIELESRLAAILKGIRYENGTKDIFMAPLPGIILDSCSLIDAVFRDEYSGEVNRNNLDIRSFHAHFEPKLKLGECRSVFFQYPLMYLSPFICWETGDNSNTVSPEWWSAYNSIKHDRIQEYKLATLSNALECLCALHQLISQSRSFIEALIRHDLVFFGQWGKDYAKEVVFANNERDVTILVETELFGTPIGARRFPDDIESISPFYFSIGKKLWRYVGKEY